MLNRGRKAGKGGSAGGAVVHDVDGVDAFGDVAEGGAREVRFVAYWGISIF